MRPVDLAGWHRLARSNEDAHIHSLEEERFDRVGLGHFRGRQQSRLCPARSAEATDRPRQTDSRGSEPTSVDLRPKFAALGLQTRVQGNRGTCSVFAMTAAIEYATAGRSDIKPPLSVEYLNWASNAATQDNEDGSYFSDLWTGFSQYGICAESAMPYQDQFSAATKPAPEAMIMARSMNRLGLQFHWIKEWNPHHGLSADQLLEVKRTLQKQYPVCGGFLWPKKQVWKDEVLQICPRSDVRDGHSILIVGYRDDPSQPGGGLFLIRNTSGDSRDGYLTYEYLREYMNDAAWIESAQRPATKTDKPVSAIEATPSSITTTTAPATFVTAPPIGPRPTRRRMSVRCCFAIRWGCWPLRKSVAIAASPATSNRGGTMRIWT